MSKLTVKQENFCNYYVETSNASIAYRKAYSCSRMMDKTIYEISSRMLKDYKISTRVKQLQDELQKRSDISKDEAVKELTNIVRTRITSIMQIKGDTIIVKNLNELPDETLAAITSIKQTSNGIEVKLYDKISAIDRLSKMLGWDETVKSELTGKDGKDLFPALQIEIIDKRDQIEDTDNKNI